MENTRFQQVARNWVEERWVWEGPHAAVSRIAWLLNVPDWAVTPMGQVIFFDTSSGWSRMYVAINHLLEDRVKEENPNE